MLTIRMHFLLCCPVDLGKGFCELFVKSLSPLGLMRTDSEKMAGLEQRAGLDSWFSSFLRQKAQTVLILKSQNFSSFSSYDLAQGNQVTVPLWFTDLLLS